jgi:LEA14-like dessication related protein
MAAMSLALAFLLAAAQSAPSASLQATVEPENELAFSIVVAGGAGDPHGRVKVELTSFELTALGDARTEGRVVFAVRNPFSFPISASVSKCAVKVNGVEIAQGKSGDRKISAKKRKALEMPFRSEKKKFKAAAGPTWVEGAWVPAELAGSLTLRLNGKDLPVDFHFAYRMGTDGAREGVFAHPLAR